MDTDKSALRALLRLEQEGRLLVGDSETRIGHSVSVQIAKYSSVNNDATLSLSSMARPLLVSKSTSHGKPATDSVRPGTRASAV